jgi:hypothetical protein
MQMPSSLKEHGVGSLLAFLPEASQNRSMTARQQRQ